jgi:streptogramin lyase
MATFQGPDFLAVDANDDLWVVDIGNSAVRKIDTAHQVTTVAELPSDYQSLGLAASGVVMADNGMLYLSVKGSVESSQNGTILEVDPASGTTREVATGRDDPWLVGSSGPTIAGIDQVGANLLATYVNGRIFTITMDDGEVTHVAGDGDKPWALADFAPGYDPFAEQAAMDLELDNHSASISGAGAFLTWADGRLLHTGIAVGYVVTEIDCQ